MEPTKIVFLWSHVRSISTAFERAFIQREDYITFHEPFGEPCYFGPERIYNYHENNLDARAVILFRKVTHSGIVWPTKVTVIQFRNSSHPIPEFLTLDYYWSNIIPSNSCQFRNCLTYRKGLTCRWMCNPSIAPTRNDQEFLPIPELQIYIV